MARRGKSAGRRARVGEPSGAAAPRNPPARRWPHVVVVVLGLAIGAVVLERLSRPREQAPPDTASQGGPATFLGYSTPHCSCTRVPSLKP